MAKITYKEQQRHIPLTEMDLTLSPPEEIKDQLKVTREHKAFRCVFEYIGLHDIPDCDQRCDHCELNQYVWWCEFLCQGWCDKCMCAQELEAKNGDA